YDVVVDAHTDTLSVIVSGGWVKGGSAGIGVTVVVNIFEANTRAFIGNETDSALPAGSVTAGRNVQVTATTEDKLFSISIAGAIAGSSTPSSPGADASKGDSNDPLDGESLPKLFGEEPTSNSNATKQKAGVGFSGDVAINDADDTTEAYISDATVNAGDDVLVSAANTAFLLSVAGAVALDLSKQSGGISIAGSFTLNDLDRIVKAYTDDATVTADNVGLRADTRDTIFSFTAGAAGGKQTTAAVLGSVNLNLIESHTEAGFWGLSVITARAAASSDAHYELSGVSVAGGVTVAGKAGIGAAVDVGIINTTVKSFVD